MYEAGEDPGIFFIGGLLEKIEKMTSVTVGRAEKG